MDITCNCGEPWHVDHMRFDVVYDAVPFGLPEAEALAFTKDFKLTPNIRRCVKEAGWEFGSSIFVIQRCPGCPDDVEVDEERKACFEAVAELMGDDLDGFASTMEDFGSY